jgi:hypothetical protein
MFTIISIVIGILFFFLLGKAILETIWGSWLIICGFFCQILAHMLYALAYWLRVLDRLFNASKNQNPTNYRKMRAAQITLTALTIIFFGTVVFITYHTFCLFSEIDWQDCSDWSDAFKAILDNAVEN